MQLNLPILHLLTDAETILIAGAGGGFDIYAGLPLAYTLEQHGKTVHLANYSFVPFELAQACGTIVEAEPTVLNGVRGKLTHEIGYFPEGYLAQWFALEHDDRTIWMFDNPGEVPLQRAYAYLVEKLDIDALILVDGGVDSLMRGDEAAPGSILEDTLSLLAVQPLDVPIKLLATIGFGTEVEEGVKHHHALENVAALTKAGAYYGACALIDQMPAFKYYEAACRYAWESDDPDQDRSRSHISTRVIPAAQGEFGNYQMYEGYRTHLFISPLMSLYWFFDATVVANRSLCGAALRGTTTKDEARLNLARWLSQITHIRPRRDIPY